MTQYRHFPAGCLVAAVVLAGCGDSGCRPSDGASDVRPAQETGDVSGEDLDVSDAGEVVPTDSGGDGTTSDTGVDTTARDVPVDTVSDAGADGADSLPPLPDGCSSDSSGDTATADSAKGDASSDVDGRCIPNCRGRACGGDGCGGTCGSCADGKVCSNHQCIWPSTSLRNDVMPIFNNYGCAKSNCHDSASAAGGLDMSSAGKTYRGMVGVRSNQCTGQLLVDADCPSTSYLINKLTGNDMCSGNKMPVVGAALKPSEIDTVRAWIGDGAKDN